MRDARGRSVSDIGNEADRLASILERVATIELRLSSVNDGTADRVRAERVGMTTVPTATPTVIPWAGAETFDTAGFHSVTVNPERLTVPPGLGGVYIVGFAVIVPAVSGAVDGWVRRNGAGVYATSRGVASAGGCRVNGVDLIELAAGDYVETVVQQLSGSDVAAGNTTDAMWMVRQGS